MAQPTLADNVRKQRKRLKLTQEALATAARMPRTAITRIETGGRLHPRSDTLGRLARALRCTVDHLLGYPGARR